MTRIAYTVIVSLAISLSLAVSSPAQSSASREGTVAPENKSLNSKTSSPVTTGSSNVDRPPQRVDKGARDNAREFYKAGVKYGRGGLFRQALESFQHAVSYDPEFTDAYYGLGHAYLDLGLYEDSIAAFEMVLKLDPKAQEVYSGLGQAYAKLNQERRSQRPRTASASGEGVALSVRPGAEKREAAVNNAERINVNDPTRIYLVGPGDVLDIRLPGSVSDESTLFTVSSTGLLEHPILGQPIKVQGLTTDEIKERLGSELRRRSIKEASPEVGVRDYNSHSILISGMVKEPGTKILRREAIPLYVVLADAQPSPEAALVTVMSQRSTNSRTVELSDPEQTSVLVQPGDVVTVRPALKQFFYVGGDVKEPGELPFRRGLTLTQAILSAGGVAVKGEKVLLTRGNGNGLLTTQEFKLKEINKGKIPDPLVEAGDRITVLP